MATALTKEVFTKYLQDLQEFLAIKFEQIDARFEQIELRFRQIEETLDIMNSKFGEHGITLNYIRQEIEEINKRLDELPERILVYADTLDVDLWHIKERVSKLEKLFLGLQSVKVGKNVSKVEKKRIPAGKR